MNYLATREDYPCLFDMLDKVRAFNTFEVSEAELEHLTASEHALEGLPATVFVRLADPEERKALMQVYPQLVRCVRFIDAFSKGELLK